MESEEAYRLVIDELPGAPLRQRTVRFVVRHVIPLFFTPAVSSGPDLAWHLTQRGRAISLTATNAGDQRFRLAAVRIADAAGRTVSFGPGLVGYALARSSMTWTIANSKVSFPPGARVTISGQTEEGPFDAQTEVQPAR